MRHHITSLLTAGAVGVTATIAMAQMDSDIPADRQDDVRLRDSSNLQDRQQRQLESRERRLEKQQTVRGTVVSLERYLKEGKDAAKPTTAAMASSSDIKALLADDGEVYIILGKQGQASERLGEADSWRQDRSSARAGSATTRGEMDLSGQAAATDEKQEPPLAETPGYEIDDTDRVAAGDANADVTIDRDAEVYGMAEPQPRRHADSLRLGQKVELTGVVHERNDINGIMVMNVRPAVDMDRDMDD